MEMKRTDALTPGWLWQAHSHCRYFPSNVGFNAPDGEDAIFEMEHSRVQAAAMQDLVPRFQAFAAEHPDVSWTYGGFQRDGLYANYPMIDQCRTENQCDGCSDPRFRSWYVVHKFRACYSDFEGSRPTLFGRASAIFKFGREVAGREIWFMLLSRTGVIACHYNRKDIQRCTHRLWQLIPTLTEIESDEATKGIQELLEPVLHPLGHASHDVTAHNLFGAPQLPATLLCRHPNEKVR
jgi:hypothetical protein